MFSFADEKLKISLEVKLEASIILKFFFFFKIFKAPISKLFPIITSRNNLFSSKANFLLTLKLHEIIPPKALIGSQASADLKHSIEFFKVETPQGFACLIITRPVFFGSDFDIFKAEKISL